jgi:hypothetical protein
MTQEDLDEGADRLRRREQLVVLVLAAVQFTTAPRLLLHQLGRPDGRNRGRVARHHR